MITLITPTGDRPEAWDLCKRWMRAQTTSLPVRWVIVDDGSTPSDMSGTPEDWEIVVLYPHPKWSKGSGSTQARNLLTAKPFVGPDDSVLIIEDDDYYHPDWIDRAAVMLQTADLVGLANMAYFNVAHMTYRRCGNLGHSCLCATGMKGEALTRFWEVLGVNQNYIDVELWRTFLGDKTISAKYDLVVGIKGLPGRLGIGIGHRMVTGVSDTAKLRELVGDEDVKHYTPYLGSALE